MKLNLNAELVKNRSRGMSWIYGIESLNRVNIVTDQKVCRPHLVSF